MSTVNNVFIQLPLFATTKICPACDPPTEKPLDAFEKHPWGYRKICKACRYARKKAFTAANKEHVAALRHAGYLAHREENLARRRVYAATHVEQRKAYDRTRYTNDPEYRQRYREYQARYVSLHRDMANAAQRAWKEAHPRKGTEYTMSYNARKRGVTVEDVDYAAILERDGMHCYICEQPILEHHRIAFDHVIPITRDGIHAASNIKVTHFVCNSRKHNKLLEEMTPFQRRGLDY